MTTITFPDVARTARPAPPSGDGVSAPDGTKGRARRWLSSRHRVWVEVVVLVGLYVAYDAGRGLAAGGRATAVRHGQDIAIVEHHLGLGVERPIQQAATHVPGLIGFFGFGYSTFHLGVTLVVLAWLYRARPEAFPRIRTALVAATGVALVVFTVFAAAPPRLDGIDITDSLSLGRATSESGLLRFLYNPYAAMPSLHVAFAVLVAVALIRYGRSPWTRVLGCIYPAYVAVEVIATGNHFVLDVIGGAATAGVALLFASKLTGSTTADGLPHPWFTCDHVAPVQLTVSRCRAVVRR